MELPGPPPPRRVVKPALHQLNNFMTQVIDWNSEDEKVKFALLVMAQNGSMGYVIPMPEEVWDEIGESIKNRNSSVAIAKDMSSLL